MPTPGLCTEVIGPCSKGSEDRLPMLLGDPRSVVLNLDQDVVALGEHLDPHLTLRRCVACRIHQQVLDDPGDHLRIDPGAHRPRVDVDLAPGHRLGVPDQQGDEPADRDLLQLRLDHAAGEALRVEQVRHDGVEPTRLGREAVDQLLALLFGDAEPVALLERERVAEDRRQRRPDVVRDRGEERRLDLIGPADVVRRPSFEVERPGEISVAALASEMSIITPCQCTGVPSWSRRSTASSRTQTLSVHPLRAADTRRSTVHPTHRCGTTPRGRDRDRRDAGRSPTISASPVATSGGYPSMVSMNGLT